MAGASDRLGPISEGEVYPIEVFSRLTGLGAWGLRVARRNGLKVRQVGRRRYVRGTDWHAFLAHEEEK